MPSPLPIEEYVEEFRAGWRERFGHDPPPSLVELHEIAERWERGLPLEDEPRLPRLTLIQGGRDDAS